MSDPNAPFRIWIAGANEWLPGPNFSSLDRAIASAHKLAASGEVAIELPSRHWHQFRENGEKFLGPTHVLAKGSHTDLADRASAVIANQARNDASNQAYQLSLGRVRTVRKTTDPRRTSGVHISTPHTLESTELEAAVPAASVISQSIPVRERREATRYEASLILKDPSCDIRSKRTQIVDISESGLQIAIPAGVHLNVAGNVVLVFSGQHGFFELAGRACWIAGGNAGVELGGTSSNLVGKMFLRKMIAQWRDREARRNKARR